MRRFLLKRRLHGLRVGLKGSWNVFPLPIVQGVPLIPHRNLRRFQNRSEVDPKFERFFREWREKQRRQREDWEWDPKKEFKFKDLWRSIFLSALFIPSCFFASIYVHKKFMKIKKKNSVQTLKSTGISARYRSVIERNWYKYGRKNFDTTMHLLVGFNCLIFFLWQTRSFGRLCSKYFLNRYADRRWLPLIGSSFSHSGVFHLYVNMMAFYSFASGLYFIVGNEQFLSFWLTCGCFSALFSRVLNYVRFSVGGKLSPVFYKSGALGASGVITGMIMLMAVLFPENRVRLMFFPSNFNFTISSAVKVGVLFDLVGVMMGWRGIDHLAHLGGWLFGYVYAKYGLKKWMKTADTDFSRFMLSFIRKPKKMVDKKKVVA